MWLTERLSPDFKTIAEFRKDNGKAMVRVCRQFVGICRRLELFSQALMAIDGSKFKAVHSGDRNSVEIHNGKEAAIHPLVPKPRTSNTRVGARFTKDDFRYEPGQNQYRCPAGEALTWRFQTIETGLNMHVYLRLEPSIRSWFRGEANSPDATQEYLGITSCDRAPLASSPGLIHGLSRYLILRR